MCESALPPSWILPLEAKFGPKPLLHPPPVNSEPLRLRMMFSFETSFKNELWERSGGHFVTFELPRCV